MSLIICSTVHEVCEAAPFSASNITPCNGFGVYWGVKQSQEIIRERLPLRAHLKKQPVPFFIPNHKKFEFVIKALSEFSAPQVMQTMGI